MVTRKAQGLMALKKSDDELFPAQHAGAKYQDHIIYFECATATFWKQQHLKVYFNSHLPDEG